MDINNPHNQSYWFVLREDQSNVIFSSNNFAIQNPQITGQDARYIVDTGDNRQYIQVNEAPIVVQESISESAEKEIKPKDDDNFWDRNKIKLLLTLCLENRYRNVTKDKTFWDEIAIHLGSSSDECVKKYRNLRRTYIRLLKKKRLGKDIKWVHYNTCEEVFKECKSLPPSVLEPWEEHKVRRLLSLYIENLNKFRNPDCLQKDVWREIASQLGTTEYNCYHKFKNLKRAYFNWKERSRESGKPIKWQYHNYFERIFYNYNPNIGPWDKNKTRLLIEEYKQIADKFKNPRYQKKELWKEIAASVGERPMDCDKKFRNLKQTYIRLKMRADTGRCITKWRYYKDFETIYSGPTCFMSSQGPIKANKSPEDDYVKQLLTFYVDNKDRFRDPLVKKKSVWRMLAPRIGMTSEECDRKFRNLKQTYIRLAERKKETGKINSWPYYSYFERIFDDNTGGNHLCNHGFNIDNMTVTEIKRIMQEVQDRKDNDRFESLVQAVEESNNIQRERNRILQALLDKK
ncbi:hypothetical protein B5X24_HaOG209903 [Helicoverpa armigera]|uniref:MADF domain-containing protein n=1 Tax=Helicoverpa armigera TaxID=29058 RepID=A0A2W1BNH0_HELAM|nr:uncharacterized protein LOC110380777 isoform X1 [Helicoverpa armigera]PZC73223.1 hypothetical protein B5X24_HaOG209903 [Helicoverpa armigera]